MAPKRLKEKDNPADVPSGEHNVQDAFLRGLEAERVLVKNMRRKVKYGKFLWQPDHLFLKYFYLLHSQVDKMKSQLSPKVGASTIRDVPQNQRRGLLEDGVCNLTPTKGSVQISLLVFKPIRLGGTMSKSNSSSSSNSPAILSPKLNFQRETLTTSKQGIHPTRKRET